jgi:stage II sporulation protein AB (anti-sigma F factor)
MAKRNLAELKIPASAASIPVAKRVLATLGGQLGLSLTDIDEMTIALTQACDSAIEGAAAWEGHADLKLTYFATNRALVIDVDLMPQATNLLMHQSAIAEVDEELQRLAYEMIRIFVDELQVEPKVGHLRFRMVKHLAG